VVDDALGGIVEGRCIVANARELSRLFALRVFYAVEGAAESFV
jgi:hypothetical protein